MRKRIKTIGSSQGIYFNVNDMKDYNLQVGDLLELTFKKVKVE